MPSKLPAAEVHPIYTKATSTSADGLELFDRDRQGFGVKVQASFVCSSVKEILHMCVL
jgi:hypothetical protein